MSELRQQKPSKVSNAI